MRSELESGFEVVTPFVVYSEVFGLRSVWITVRIDPGNAFCPDAKPLVGFGLCGLPFAVTLVMPSVPTPNR
jgi:hypothetical protein